MAALSTTDSLAYASTEVKSKKPCFGRPKARELL